MKGSFTLGETPVEYKSAAMNQFTPIQDRPNKVAPVYKNYNQRVDIITGQIKDINQKNYGFERFTEHK
jgi:hypothetical protein